MCARVCVSPLFCSRGSKSLSHPLLEIENAGTKESRASLYFIILYIYICYISRGDYIIYASPLRDIIKLLVNKGNFRLLIWNQPDAFVYIDKKERSRGIGKESCQ